LIAVLFNEDFGSWAIDRLQENRRYLRMSTVNYTEALILIEDRQPQLVHQMRTMIEESLIRFVPVSVAHAEMAAAARLRFPLNLGDCFAYALAKQENCPVLTLDRDFRKTDVPAILPNMI
jgi:ribonuclease VapC